MAGQHRHVRQRWTGPEPHRRTEPLRRQLLVAGASGVEPGSHQPPEPGQIHVHVSGVKRVAAHHPAEDLAGRARNKWPFLPSAFHTDLDAAAVVIDGRSWRYVFVKDDQIITFNDGGVLNNIPFPSFPDSVRRNMDALSVYWFDRVQAYAVTQGESLYSFIPGVGFGQPFRVPSFVPLEFRSNFDDISFEKEGDGVKVSIYKGYGRYIYYDSIFGGDFEVERLDVRNKWPHLQTFFNTTL